MSIKISRRKFLAGLAAGAASIALPVELANLTLGATKQKIIIHRAETVIADTFKNYFRCLAYVEGHPEDQMYCAFQYDPCAFKIDVYKEFVLDGEYDDEVDDLFKVFKKDMMTRLEIGFRKKGYNV